jgi:hypothetical protein
MSKNRIGFATDFNLINSNVGIGTTNPLAKLDVIGDVRVTGIITASSFSGDGTNLTGVSGFATALSLSRSSPLNQIFKTPKVLTIGAGISIKVESDETSGNIAFARFAQIQVSAGATFAIGSGTTFILNVLKLF